MARIEIYTRPGCGYCTHAKRLLKNKGVEFTEYNVYENPRYIKQLEQRSASKTYPQIFIDNKSIGGFTDLLVKEKYGLLAKKI